MRRLILATALVVATTGAEAQEQPYLYQSEAYCQHLAEMATAFAHDREAGDSLESARRVIQEYSDEVDDEILVDWWSVADTVYLYPRLPPDQEGNVIFTHCMGYE